MDYHECFILCEKMVDEYELERNMNLNPRAADERETFPEKFFFWFDDVVNVRTSGSTEWPTQIIFCTGEVACINTPYKEFISKLIEWKESMVLNLDFDDDSDCDCDCGKCCCDSVQDDE